MEKNIIGKTRAEMRTAGCRKVRSTERRASAVTWVRSDEPILRLRLLCPLFLTLERAPRLLQEDVVEGGCVEPQVRDLEALCVERSDHVGEVAPVEADGDDPGLGGDLLPEAPQDLHDGGALPRLGGRSLD